MIKSGKSDWSNILLIQIKKQESKRRKVNVMSAVTETRLVLKVAKIPDNKIQKSFQSLRNINWEKRDTTQAHDFNVPFIFPQWNFLFLEIEQIL